MAAGASSLLRPAAARRLVWPARAACQATDPPQPHAGCSPLPCRVLCIIIGLPLNLVLLGLFCWYQAAGGAKRFAASFAGSSAAVALLLALLLLHFQRLVRGRC